MEGCSSSSSISKKVDFSTLYDQHKSAIWLFWSREDGGYFTGFGVHVSGLVMSITHGWIHRKNKEFIARRIDKDKFHRVTLVDCNEAYDVSLFRIENIKKNDFPVVNFATDGSLDEGCRVFTIGNPACFTASFSLGFVSYSCVDDVGLPLVDEKCLEYELDSVIQSPSHRVYGHLWHKDYFYEVLKVITEMEHPEETWSQSHEYKLYRFHGNLNARVPIIQCNGITSFPGASGSPLFNMNGEVVGILVSRDFGFQIFVHVSLLKHYLNGYLAKHMSRP